MTAFILLNVATDKKQPDAQTRRTHVCQQAGQSRTDYLRSHAERYSGTHDRKGAVSVDGVNMTEICLLYLKLGLKMSDKMLCL